MGIKVFKSVHRGTTRYSHGEPGIPLAPVEFHEGRGGFGMVLAFHRDYDVDEHVDDLPQLPNLLLEVLDGGLQFLDVIGHGVPSRQSLGFRS